MQAARNSPLKPEADMIGRQPRILIRAHLHLNRRQNGQLTRSPVLPFSSVRIDDRVREDDPSMNLVRKVGQTGPHFKGIIVPGLGSKYPTNIHEGAASKLPSQQVVVGNHHGIGFELPFFTVTRFSLGVCQKSVAVN